jgi:uncharacterized protein
MSDNTFGGFFISDDDELLQQSTPTPAPAQAPAAAPAPAVTPAPTASPAPGVPGLGRIPEVHAVQPVAAPIGPVANVPTREDRLAAALDALMENNREIKASALVSLDGFTMASALPESMHDDRVGAMSAAILGLGERAAAELGRGALTQVFIEGDDGYVMLIAAGDRAVLTCISGIDAKLGLVLYDMRETAELIAEILG